MPGAERAAAWGVIARFAVAGLANTALGLAVILILDLGIGLAPALANATGYVAGVAASWALQRRFVFRSGETGWATKARFAAVLASAFAMNQLVLGLLAGSLGGGPEPRLVAQLGAVATAAMVQFLLLNGWVFRRRSAGALQSSSRRIP